VTAADIARCEEIVTRLAWVFTAREMRELRALLAYARERHVPAVQTDLPLGRDDAEVVV